MHLFRLRPALIALALTLPPALAAPTARATEVLVTAEDLVPLGPDLWMGAGLTLPPPDATQPLLGARVDGPAASQLRRLAARGVAQGFDGILYDNRDRAHSTLAADRFPSLPRLTYGPGLIDDGTDYGLAGELLLPAVVFGNSSTAITTGEIPRSLPRFAMTTRDGPARSARLYRNNALYFYPEHRDHDAADRFPVNWPYMGVSQGSSGSDRVFLEAIALTLAAFPPETFEALRNSRRVAPTLQMILRRNLEGVNRAEDYLTAAAHPVVIDGARLRPGRMVAQAAALTPEAIPPLVQLNVLSETFSRRAGLARLSERLFDTGQAVARLWRSPAGLQEIVVSAAGTVDPEGRPIAFRWILLQGDPTRVEIAPLDDTGATARIRLLWHDPWEVPAEIEARGEDEPPKTRQLSRIDIAVFAEVAGAAPSAPAFVTVDIPEHQNRRYGAGPEAARLISIDYDAVGRDTPYDPLLYWSAPWSDAPVADAAGRLAGWRRTHADGRVEDVPIGAAYVRTGDRRRPTLAPAPAATAE